MAAAFDNAVLDATVTSPSDWSYVAEGGATMVFSYQGSAHPSFSGRVLRLAKASNSELLASSEGGRGQEDDKAASSIAFQDLVIARLLPHLYLPSLYTAQTSKDWLEELAAQAEVARPPERRLKDGIDTRRTRAILATDLVGDNVVAVEIKPKWGFLPNAAHLSPETARLKSSHCRYCMHKYLKSAPRSATTSEGSSPPSPAEPASCPSLYCPLDLFSGDERRMRRALVNLWDDWTATRGGTNNFRLFVQGNKVDPGDPTSLGELSLFLSAPSSETSVREVLLDRLLIVLLQNPLLDHIRRLQKTLDPLDIEGLSALHASIHPGLPLGSLDRDPTPGEWQTFVGSYLSDSIPSAPDAKLRYYVLAYLLSATFKDCSIIIRIPREETTAGSVHAIDLDAKGIVRLHSWERLDKEIVDAFAHSGIAECCVE